MFKRLASAWSALDQETTVSKKLVFFELMTAALGGVLIGFICSPHRDLKIGSENQGNGCGNGTTSYNGCEINEDESEEE